MISNKFYNKQKGFTLIEMMVAVSIFVIVAFIVTVTFINLTAAYRYSQGMQQIIDNLNFSLDLIRIN